MTLNIPEINQKLLKAMLNSKDVKIISNTFSKKFSFDIEEELSLLDPDAFEIKKQAIVLFTNKMKEILDIEKKISKAVLKFEGYTYIFDKPYIGSNIYLICYKNYNFSKIDPKYKATVSKDVSKFINYYEELTSLYERNDFNLLKNNSHNIYNFTISGQGFYTQETTYVTEHFLVLCERFKEAFNQTELKLLKDINKNKYGKIKQSKNEITVQDMFTKWFEYLSFNNYTVNNQFIFNDHDNFSFMDSNDKYQLISQKSQNVVYVYIKDIKTGQIKVWNCADIPRLEDIETIIDDFNEDKKSYIKAIMDLMSPYSYDTYLVNLDNKKTYMKTYNYYLNNFESEENIILDTKLGYSNRSNHCQNLFSDFQLLSDALDSHIEHYDD